MRSLATGLLFLAATALPAFAFQQGDWVLAQWQGGAYYYPGVVAQVQGNMVTVRYDDGDLDTRPANQIRYYNWQQGSRVECNFRGAGRWYPGRIAQMSGNTNLTIFYDDGDTENTITGRCRSQ